MAQRNIDFGAFPDDPDADAIRSAFEKVQLNFTEVFAGLGDQAVVSVNKTAGPGIFSVNGSPVGNVVLGANISCVQFTSTTLSLGRSPGTGPGSATITDSSQTLYIDMPNTVANITDVIVSNSVQGNAIIGNVSGDFGYILANATSGNGNINANNITLSAALSAANVSGNGAGLSAIAGANVTGTVPSATIAGTVTTIAQPNITSLGTLTTLDVQSTITAVAFTANTGLFTGDGGGLSNLTAASLVGAVPFATTANAVAGANVSGEVTNAATANAVAGANVSGAVATATTSGTVTTAAQPNITSTGTLTLLTVTGNVTAGNVAGTGGVFTYVTGDGANLSAITGANVTGSVPFASTANAVAGANVSGEVTNAATANAVAGANVSGEVPNSAIANSVAGANVSGEVTNAAIANAVAGANVSGEVTFAATANAVAGANVSGAVTFAGTANAVAAANITGTINLATFAGTANAVAGANVSGEVSYAATANAVAGANVSGAVPFATTANAIAGANVSGAVSFATTANAVAGANVGGTVPLATTAGTVTTAAQPNITSTGTLTSLAVSGNATTGNISGTGGVFTYVSGDGANLTNISVSAGAFIENGTSNVQVDASGPIRVSSAGTANILSVKNTGTSVEVTGSMSVSGGFDNNINFNSTANLGPESNVTITGGASGAFLKTNGSGSLSWDTATLVPAQGADTQVIFNDGGSLYAGNTGFTYNKTTGNLNVPGSIDVVGAISAGIVGGSLTTVDQPNISSVGTLTGLILSGNLNTNSDLITNAGNITIAGGTGTFIGDGGGLSNINGANVSGINTASISNGTSNVRIASAGGEISFAVNGATAATLSSSQLGVATLVTAPAFTANTGLFTGDGGGLSNVVGANVTGEVTFAATANAVAGANVSGTVALATSAGTVTTAAQPSITSLGTLTGLGVNGTITASAITANTGLFSGNGAGLTNIIGANVAGSVATADNVILNAQPNITSTGTLTALSVTGNVSAGNVSGTGGVFTYVSGDGANLTNITGANVGGQVGFAAIANSVAGGNVSGTVANAQYAVSAGSSALALNITGASQPNITSVGTLTSLTVSGNITNQTHIIKDVTTATAAGTSQGNATGLAGADIYSVTVNTTNNGVRLMTATTGMCIYIKNLSASNNLTVYPAVGGTVDDNGTNGGMTIGPKGHIQFVAHGASQWYTVGATYA